MALDTTPGARRSADQSTRRCVMRGLRVARIVPISHTDDDTLPGVFRELLISYAPAALSDALVADAVACAVRVRLVDLSDGVMVCIGSQAA